MISAYDHLGSYLSDQCHVMIAVWNGEYSGKIGGTGEVVKKYWLRVSLFTGYIRTIFVDNAVNSLRKLKKNGEIQVLGKHRDIQIDKFSLV